MQSLKEKSRQLLLVEQFHIHDHTIRDHEIKASLERIFTYILTKTKIWYIEFIDEKVLYDYIRYQCRNSKEVDFYQAVRDVKNYLYFLRYIRRSKYIPEVDLSIKNLLLWLKI